jgi:hypothetical protein
VTASTRSPSIQRLNGWITFWLSVGTALLSAALGVVPDLIAGSTGETDFSPRLWSGLGGLFLGSLALLGAYSRWRRRNLLLRDRGTVFVVDSPLETWTSEDKDAYLRDAATQFADFATVPGPTGLSSSWRWPLGDQRSEQWSDAVDDLVVSFRSVWLNDDRTTGNSIVCWAAFPVAIAWTARVLATERFLPLAIRQRPSDGRAGKAALPAWHQGTHTFRGAAPTERRGETRPVREAVVDLTAHSPSSDPGMWPPDVRVLLIRANGAPWEGLRPDRATDPVRLSIANLSGQTWGAGGAAELHEWRCVLPPGQFHPWDSYPDLAAEITLWIEETADSDGVNLIGMLVPQEIGLGIGIGVARLDEKSWPTSLWPIVKPSPRHGLVIPGLDLGWASLHHEYLARPR